MTTTAYKTIDIESELAQYSDFGTRNQGIEVAEVDGVGYVGVEVNSRGFSNTIYNLVARVDNAEGLAVLMGRIERDYNREASDGYRADWMTGADLAKYLGFQRYSKKPVLIASADGVETAEYL